MSKAIETDVAVLKNRVDGHDKDLARKVDKTEFLPVRLLVYGGTAVILLAVIATLLKLIHLDVPHGG